MLTFHAAPEDSKGYPSAGFQMENALTRETLKGMTIWALILILKKRKGSLEVGKWADFVLFDKDIMKIEESSFKMKPAVPI
jgi:predicted amidohydrolase YtcJ